MSAGMMLRRHYAEREAATPLPEPQEPPKEKEEAPKKRGRPKKGE